MQSSWQAPCSYSLTKLFDSEQIRSECLAIAELCRSIAALRVEKIQQTGCAMPVGVLADVTGLFRLVEITRTIESDNFVVGAQIFKGIPHIRQYLSRRELCLLLGLSDREARACNLPLIAIEDRHLDLSE